MKRKFFLLSLIGIIASAAVAQDIKLCPESEDRVAVSAYHKARSAKKSRKPYDKIKILCEKAVRIDSSFGLPWLLLGDAAWYAKDFKTTKKAYRKAIATCPDASDRMHYRLGSYLYDTKMYREAIPFLRSFLEFNSKNELRNKEAALLIVRAKLMGNPVPFDPKVVKGISTADPEYLEIITADNK